MLREYLWRWNTPRRIVQILSFVFFSAIIFNLGALPLLFPVLWTWGLNPNTVGDAYTAIQLMLYQTVFPWLAIASFIVVGVIIGKAMCGWVCPFGFVQDLIDFINRGKRDFSLRSHQTLVWGKYVILAVTGFISITFAIAKSLGFSAGYQSALGLFVQAPFTALSPAETLFGILPRNIQGFQIALTQKPVLDVISGITSLSLLFWVQFVILVAVLVLVAYVPRAWCRYVCPHGAIMAIMNNFSFIGLRRDPVKCTKGGCGQCVQVCPTRVPILDQPWEKFSHEECIYCMKCVDACKDHAIKTTYP